MVYFPCMRFLFVFLIPIFAAYAENSQPEKAREADRFLAEGRADTAAVLLARRAAEAPSATARHDLALALLAAKDTAAAVAIWKERTAAAGGDRAFKAQYQLGRLEQSGGNDSAALAHFVLAAAACDEEWRFPILYSAAEAAYACKDSSQGRIFVQELSRRYGKFFGKAHLDSIMKAPVPLNSSTEHAAKKASGPADTVRTKPPARAPSIVPNPIGTAPKKDSCWVLQVGAFVKRENAAKGAAELGKRFPRLNPGILEPLPGSTYYRAVLGRYSSEEKALEAGRSLLSPRDVKFRVVHGLPSAP